MILELYIYDHFPLSALEGLAGERFGGGEEVADMHLGYSVELHGAENARKARHILTFQIGRIAVTVDFGGDNVLALLQIGSDTERGRVAGVLGEADILAVDPQVEERIHTVKLDVDFLAFPFSRHGEVAAVAAHGIALGIVGVVFGRRSHHARPITCERVGLVAVKCRAPAFFAFRMGSDGLPVGRDNDGFPLGDIIIGILETDRPLRGVFAPLEFPLGLGIERLPACAVARQNPLGRFGIFEAEGPGAGGLFVQGEVLFLFPFKPRWCGNFAKLRHRKPHCRQTAETAQQKCFFNHDV